jgi:hypothetical protein
MEDAGTEVISLSTESRMLGIPPAMNSILLNNAD